MKSAEQKTNEELTRLDRLCEWIATHRIRSLVGLGLIFVVCTLTAFSWPLLSTAITVASYFFFGLIIFAISKPGKSEASIIFFLVIWTAILYITIFGIIYSEAKAIKCAIEECNVLELDYFYYSTVVFTSLGFGDYLPSNWMGKLITSIQALLGLAYSSTILILILGRSQWLTGNNTNIKKAEDTQSSNTPPTDLAQQIAALERQLAYAPSPRTVRPLPSNKKHVSWVGWAGVVALGVLIACNR